MVDVADYTPGEDYVTAIAAAVPALDVGSNIFIGPREAYGDQLKSIPHEAVFVNPTGGLPSRPIKGSGRTPPLPANDLVDERQPVLNIRIRSKPPSVSTAFREGLALARAVYEAVDQKPLATYIEARVRNSHPSYLGRDDDGHHEWVILVELVVDVTGL